MMTMDAAAETAIGGHEIGGAEIACAGGNESAIATKGQKKAMTD